MVNGQSKTNRSVRFALGRLDSMRLSLLLRCIFAGFLLAQVAAAQISTRGTIAGLVVGPSGQAISGAKVTVTNLRTNASEEKITNDAGYFEADSLPPGHYKLSAISPGLLPAVRNRIALPAGAYVDITLRQKRGATSASIAASPSAVQLLSPTRGVLLTIEAERLQPVPVESLLLRYLSGNTAGVQTTHGSTAVPDGKLSWNGLSSFGVNGVEGSNEVDLDGVPNGKGKQTGVNLAPDDLQN